MRSRPERPCQGPCPEGWKMFGKRKNHAYWIRRTHLLRADEYVCSSCGSSFRKAKAACPDCGADMRSTKYDPSWVDEAEWLDILDE